MTILTIMAILITNTHNNNNNSSNNDQHLQSVLGPDHKQNVNYLTADGRGGSGLEG